MVARRARWPWLAAPTVAALVLTAALPAWGHAATPSTPRASVSDLPPGPLKDQLLKVQRRAREDNIAPGAIERPIAEAVRAMQRAAGARAAGDQVHAALLEKLAARWARAASAVVKAALVEEQARRHAAEARELLIKLERARTLLAEQQARRGRLTAELHKLQAKAKEAAADAAAREQKRMDKAEKRKPGNKQPKGKGKGR